MTPAKPSPKPTFLIVEDEELLRSYASELVAEAGFQPIEAEDAGRAIAILEEAPDVGIALVDVQLPGTRDGRKLVSVIRHRWPSVGIIVTSGFYALGAGDLPKGAQFLLKPYSLDDLASAIEKLGSAWDTDYPDAPH